MSPSVSFKTVGCRLNQAETAKIAASFEEHGYRCVPFEERADVVVVHSCTITRAAQKTSVQYARSARKASHSPFVVIAGCAVEVDRQGIIEASGADLAVGQSEKWHLPKLVAARLAGESLNDGIPRCKEPLPRFDTTRALLKVQDGCDFGCSYCIVPRARGRSRSRPFEDILEETRRLADAGYKEVTLTGANLGCYSDGAKRLVDLIAAIEDIPAILRIRLSSIELSTTEKAVIDLMSTSRKVCRYLHIPLQSGDDRVLRAMGRRHNSSDFRAVVEYATSLLPDLGLGTDVIAGFPTEDEEAFENTCGLLNALPFTNLHVFPYSPRQGTRAAELPPSASREDKKARVDRLLAIRARKRASFAASFIGKPVCMLTETVSGEGIAAGWTSEYVRARLSDPTLTTNQLATFCPRCVHEGVLLG